MGARLGSQLVMEDVGESWHLRFPQEAHIQKAWARFEICHSFFPWIFLNFCVAGTIYNKE